MGLIKAEVAPPSVVAFSMRDIEEHAKSIIRRAREQADQLLAAAQTQGEQLRVEGRAEGLAAGKKEGFAKGLEEGRAAGRQQALKEQGDQLRNLIASLTTAVGALERGRSELEVSALQEVVHLAVSIARRVTKRQGLIDPQVLADNLGEAMKLVVHAADLRIAFHPEQRKALTEVLPQLSLTWPQLKHAELVEDASLAPGGCRLFSRQGEVDADLDTQLDRVVAELLPASEPAVD